MKILNTTSVLAGVALLLSGVSASAGFIDGDLGFTGSFTPTDMNGDAVSLGDATGIDFFRTMGPNQVFDDEFLVTGASGDFLDSGIFFGDIGTINDFQFSPLDAPVAPLYEIGIFSFTLNTIQIVAQSNSSLILEGSGMMSGTGFEDTYGTWVLTGNAGRSIFNFSSTSVVVAEPASLALIGLSMIGFAASRRKLLG